MPQLWKENTMKTRKTDQVALIEERDYGIQAHEKGSARKSIDQSISPSPMDFSCWPGS